MTSWLCDNLLAFPKKKTKGIYGKASKKDIQELKEEGIETQIFPWLNNKDN